jgi:hypothetical protein
VPPLIFAASPGGPARAADIFRQEAKDAHRDTMRFVQTALDRVDSISALVKLAPTLIGHAEAEYLRYDPGKQTASRSAYRPRLAGDGTRANHGKEHPHV